MDHVVPLREKEEEEEEETPAAAIESSLSVETPTNGKRFPMSLKPKREAFMNRVPEGTPNDEQVLRVRPIEQQQQQQRPAGRGRPVFRRRKKALAAVAAAAEEEDDSDEEDSADDLPTISSTSKYLSPLPEEHSSTDGGEESEEHQVESSDYGLYSSNETSDYQDDSAPPTPLHLSDREVDGENARKPETKNGSEQTTARRDKEYFEIESSEIQSSQSEADVLLDGELTPTLVEEIKSLRRNVALAPIATTTEETQDVAVLREGSSSGSDDEIWDWPAGEKAPDPLEGSGASISDTSEPMLQEHEGTIMEKEKKKKFHLRGIRKKKGSGATSPAHGDVAVEETHEPESMSPTKLRHRKKFGRKKNKTLDEDADGPLSESQKDLRRAIKLPRNEHESLLQESDSFTPKKEKVRERIKRRLKKGHRKGTLSIDSGEFWEWEQSDSDDAELFSQIGGENDDSQSDVFNGTDLHATDFDNVPNCGVPLTPMKDGVPLRSRLKSRDKKELRVKPYFCFAPHKVYMTQDEIYQNMVQPSEIVENVESFVEPWYEVKKESISETERIVWGNTDDGRIGSLKVEVLGCVGLSKHKADAIVYLVCGDAAFATDVIPSSRSPMWPACSKRAACFPVFHAYASLYIGVFDVIARRNSENDTFCGRASLDLAILRPDSEYDVTLPLRGSSFIYDRRPQGVVRLRFSLHWFSERAAVLSYLKAPRNMASTYRLPEQPSIPCADPKTFRNVAVTIHGPELPGKYTKKAFQATMREFTLYWQNFKFMAKSSVRDAVLYEQPLKSLYIFLGWMHCAINSSVRFVPAYVVGFLIILLLEGYVLHAANESRSGGYSPVSIQELLLALLQSNKSRQIRPLLREKKVRKEFSKEENDGGDGDPCDHMEFPFSDRYEYKRRSIEDSLVTRHTRSRKEKLEELELQGRLSIYVKSASFGSGKSVDVDGDDTVASSINPGNDIGDSEHGDFDSDPELDVHGDVDNVFELDMDDEEDNQPLLARSSRSLSASSMKSSIVVGPPQDTDMKPKRKVPPQVHLARLEDKLNKLTQSLSMDRVFSSTLAYRPQPQQDDDANFRSVMGAHHVAGGKKKGKRIPLDEFDKRLGYRLRHTNPVTEITSSYLGPLMRIFRILCTLTRVIFNVGVWSDPYLSFWVLCFLILLLLVLIVFPWRLFFFAVGIICFGPQNFLVGSRLARKATEETPEVEEEPTKPAELTALDNNTEATPKKGTRRSAHKNPIAKLKERRQKRLAEKQESRESGGAATSSFAELEHNGSNLDNRPAFSAAAKATRKQVQPREIVVPYSRFRKERFYDWPPDPTGSRATPIRFENCKFEATQLFE